MLSKGNAEYFLSLGACSDNQSNERPETEKSLLDEITQLSADTVGNACHFNGSKKKNKSKKHNKISGNTTRICKWTTNIPGMKPLSKYQNEHKEHYQAGDKSRDKYEETMIRF